MEEGDHDVTIGVVNYNGAERTLATIGSVLEQGAHASSIVVVDNGSDHDDRETLRAGLTPGIALLELPLNRGYAAGCNEIARRAVSAGSQFVWFLNNDIHLEDRVLAALRSELEAEPAAFGAGPVTVDTNDPSLVLGAGASLSLWRARAHHRGFGRTRHQLPSQPYDVDMLEGACPLIRVEALVHTGGWDEGFFMYWEDAELSVRARRAGYRLRAVPTAFVRHAGAASSARGWRDELMLRNRIRFARIVNPPPLQVAFIAYFIGLWLPAYAAARLVPRYGLLRGSGMATASLTWNLRDAIRRRRWRLRPVDQQIAALGEERAAHSTKSSPARAAESAGTAGRNAANNPASSQKDA